MNIISNFFVLQISWQILWHTSMISEKEYQVVLAGTLLASRFGIMPTDWDEKKQILVPTRSTWKKAISPGLLCIHAAYLLFVIYRESAQLRSGEGVEKTLIQSLFLSIHVMGCLYHLHVILYSREVVDLFNLLGNFTSTQGPHSHVSLVVRNRNNL
jgi:hypothetical protein